jgi:hypothetical protein
MAITDRMLKGAIASNPANYAGDGEYRYSRTRGEIFFSSAKKPHPYDNEPWIALPALDPDGSNKLNIAFQRYIASWPPARQAELERFAARKGWDMARELKYGGGALEDDEASEWQKIVDARLDQLVRQARALIEEEQAP